MGIAIVGAGVAGCYCAYRLSRAGVTEPLDLFEASDRIGGRLWSVPLDGVAGSPAEIGGMFFSDLQENTFGLITQELNLPHAPVNWTRRHQYLRGLYLDDASYANGAAIPFHLTGEEAGKTPGALLLHALEQIIPGIAKLWPMDMSRPELTPQASIAYLRGFVRDGRRLTDWGFWNLLADAVSNEAYNLLLSTLGSAAIFRNANAYDAIWTFMNEAADRQTYYKIIAGYQSLPETLLDAANACTVHRGRTLVRIERRQDSFRLHFETDDVISTFEADKVILALPRRALELVEMDEAVINADDWSDLLDAVLPVPACKLFLAFEAPWWNVSASGPTVLNSADVSVAYTDLPMRQCYYFGAPAGREPALLMATYADDVATSFWSGLRNPGFYTLRAPATPGRRALSTSDAMEATARKQLSAMHRDHDVPAPIDGLFFDWSEDPYGAAWHAWAPYRRSWEVVQTIKRPNPALDLFTCGEAFAQHQGWVEGALNSAELVLRDFGLDRPAWVRPDYSFEL
jgi:monoamine oxidase